MSIVFGTFAIACPIFLSAIAGMRATRFCLSRQRNYLQGSEKLSDVLIDNALIGALVIALAGGFTFWVGKKLGEIPQNLIAKESSK